MMNRVVLAQAPPPSTPAVLETMVQLTMGESVPTGPTEYTPPPNRAAALPARTVFTTTAGFVVP